MAEDDVLGHGKRRDQHEVLVDHPDAKANGIERTMQVDGLAVEEDLAGIRSQKAVHDVHQGGFAGAVFAQQRVDLAPADVQVHAVIRPQLSEGLDDPPEP